MQTKLSGGKSQISTVGVHTSHGLIGTFPPLVFILKVSYLLK